MDAKEIVRLAKAEPEIRLFSERAIAVGAFLGGPLAGCYLLTYNFRSLKESARAKKSFIFGISATLIVPFFASLFPSFFTHYRVQNIILRFLVAEIFYYIVRYFQKDIIKAYREKDLLGSGWIVFTAGIAGALITIFYIMAFTLIYPTNYLSNEPNDPNIVRLNKTGVSYNLAPLKIEKASGILYYDSLNIKIKDAENIGKLIRDTGYLKNNVNNEADLYKHGDAYIVDIDMPRTNWFDPQTQKRNKQFMEKFYKSFPNNKLQIILVYIDSSGVMQKYYTDIK